MLCRLVRLPFAGAPGSDPGTQDEPECGLPEAAASRVLPQRGWRGARPATPRTPGQFIAKARTTRPTPDESQTARTTPPRQRPLTDRPNDSHKRPTGSLFDR